MPPAPAGPFAADFSAPLDDAGGGLPAFTARDAAGRDVAMAVLVAPGRPPRPLPIAALATPIPGVLCPLGHALVTRTPGGPAEHVLFCGRPGGPPLSRQAGAWTDAALLAEVLRPVAQALGLLHAAGVIHRGITPDNLFRATADGGPAVLGQAWAAPPASLQPALFLTPEAAMCLPSGRGDGAPADDVYALGITLAVLALGSQPMALSGLDDDAMILRKLDRGSAAAVLDGARLSITMTGLIRAMLADDPDHRPTPERLLDLGAVLSRQAGGRTQRRAAQLLVIGSIAASDPRVLAFAMARAPEAARTALADGSVALWLRRALLDTTLAGRIEDIVVGTRSSASSEPASAARVRTMAAIAVLDSHAPVCWGGLSFMPDGLATALASATPERLSPLIELVRDEALASFCSQRPDHRDVSVWRASARQFRGWLATPGWAGGIDRLRYAANPLLGLTPADSGGLGAALTPADVVEALDRRAAGTAFDQAGTPPLTARLAAFMAARLDARFETEIDGAAESGPAGRAGELEFFAHLQRSLAARPLHGLAAWLAARAKPLLNAFRDAARREALRASVLACVRDGDIVTLYCALTDPAARAADTLAASAATARIAKINARLASLDGVSAARSDRARRLGQEVASGVGLGALSLALMMAAMR